jgi:N-acetylglucosamine-6-phosphate deacetylase
MTIALRNAGIFTGSECVFGKALIISAGRILGLAPENEIPADALVKDCGGNFIAPGLIDLQVYGGGGRLFSENPDPESLQLMADHLLQQGTTGFLPTIATNAPEVFEKAIAVVHYLSHDAVLGLHFEGPYINPLRKGAHPEIYIRKPEHQEVKQLLDKATGCLKMMTLAPELFGRETLRLLTNCGVTLSAGHSNASYEEAMWAFDAGIRAATHLFNAMPPLHHRQPGLAAAVIGSDRVHASIIADGIHVDFAMLSLSKKLMQERLFLITDAVEAARQGAYVHVRQKDRFTLPDGTLSGSRLTLFEAVRHCVERAGISLDEALRMASTYPAELIAANGRGRIAPGYRADLIVFTRDFHLKEVMTCGKSVHNVLSPAKKIFQSQL